MMRKIILGIFTLAVLLLAFSSTAVIAQGHTGHDVLQKITVKGNIEYSERFGGYYLIAENPPSGYFIVNQDKQVLDKLMKAGKPVKVEGHLTIGADHLMIDKINGKKYPVKPSR